jgi:hypothetical protein
MTAVATFTSVYTSIAHAHYFTALYLHLASLIVHDFRLLSSH